MEGFGRGDDSDSEDGIENTDLGLASGKPDDGRESAVRSIDGVVEGLREASVAEEGDDDAVEDGPIDTVRERMPRLVKHCSKQSVVHGSRSRMSSPIGIKEPVGPGGRRLSNSLGQTMSGYGAGSTSFH